MICKCPTLYKDRITWQRDTSADGAQVPDYSGTVAANVPCSIRQITGDETFRGTQLESHIDYVVEMLYQESVGGSLKPTDRGVVQTGALNGKVLNVQWVKYHGVRDGMLPISEVFCREQFN